MKTKRELKAAYKETKPTSGIFQLRNNVSGKALIDSAINVKAKWNRHHTELRFGSHRNKELQEDWNELGADNFEFSILSDIKPSDNESLDLNSELKDLKEMVEAELDINSEMKY